jgi:hypothetical protein
MTITSLNGTEIDGYEGLVERRALLRRDSMLGPREGVMMVVQDGVVRRDDLGLEVQ